MAVLFGTPRCSSSGRMRKRAKACSEIRDRKLQIWHWEYDWHSWTVNLKWVSLKKRRKDNRLILLYKGLKGNPVYQQMTLFPRLGMVEISTQRHFRPPLLIQMFINVASSPRLSGIGMSSPILWSHLPKMQRIVLLNSLLWWELRISFPNHRS